MEIELLDELPKSPRKGTENPVVVEFLKVLEANPGKWAAYPLDRKTRPQVGDQFSVAGRGGKWYVAYKIPAVTSDLGI